LSPGLLVSLSERKMNDIWEGEIGGLLGELAEVQTALLDTLSEKRQLLAKGDHVALSAMAPREQELASRLQACHEQRQQLLARASADGLAADSIQSLSEHLPSTSRDRVNASIREAASRTQLLQHQSLANWVLVQRSLLHLSQLIEIIATGGRTKPTYGKGSDSAASGALVDRAA
jgi:flagellar biosynthesis/type III secretory pathway chaperone